MAQRNRTKQTAAQAYTERDAEIDTEIKALVAALAGHRKKLEANPMNWGFPGDLGHVRELLVQINTFMSPAPDDEPNCDHADGCCRESVGLACNEGK